jgi:hypothetical protein
VRKEDLEANLQPEAPKPKARRWAAGPRPIGKCDALFRLVGIVSNEEAADLSENKYESSRPDLAVRDHELLSGNVGG